MRSDRTHSRSGILFRDPTHASSGVIIFVRQGLSFSELSTSSLSSLDLTPTLIYVKVNISLNNSSLLSFLNVYAPPTRSFPTDGRTDSFSPSILSSSRNLFILVSSIIQTSIAITPSGTPEVLPTPVGRKYLTGSSLLTSSLSMTLTHSRFYIAPPLTFPLLSRLLPFLAPGRCFRTWVLITYQFFYLSLSPVFPPNERPPSFNFQKARWDGFDSHCSSAEKYSSLSLTSAALFTSLILNAAKSSIPFGRIKRHLKPGGLLRWKKRLVKDTKLSLPLTKVMKIDRLTSPLLNAPRQSSPRLRHGRRHALLFHLNLTLNLYTLFFVLSLAHLPRLPPLPISLSVLLPGNRLRSMPLA